MSDEKEGYSLTTQGLIMMSTVLLRATKLGLIDMENVNESNIQDHIQVLAARDELWDGTPITDKNQKLVLLAMTLIRLTDPVDPSSTN
jgi:hypothetical protein